SVGGFLRGCSKRLSPPGMGVQEAQRSCPDGRERTFCSHSWTPIFPTLRDLPSEGFLPITSWKSEAREARLRRSRSTAGQIAGFDKQASASRLRKIRRTSKRRCLCLP